MYKQYFKQAFHMLRENRLVSVISILGTALAIAAALVMVLVFQIDSAGFAPETNRDRFLYIRGTEVAPKGDGNRNRGSMSAEVVRECFYALEKPEAVAAYAKDMSTVSLSGKRLFKEYEICYTDAGYWKIYDHHFVEGGPFGEADFRSAIPKVVLSERMADRLCGGERAVGRQLLIDYTAVTVCGVVSDVPNPHMVSHFDACVPYSCNESLMKSDIGYGENMVGALSVVVLAPSGGDFGAVRSELEEKVKRYNSGKVDYEVRFPSGLLSQMDLAMGSDAWRKVGWPEFMVGAGAFLFFLLLVPALNLTGVIQSSVQKRKEEIGLRKAFGATGGDLMAQVLSENLVQTVIGGVIGIPLAVALLVAGKAFLLNPGIEITLPMLVQPDLFAAVLVFVFLLNLLSAGIPAWSTMRQPIVEALKGTE